MKSLKDNDAFWGAFGKKLNDEKFCKKLEKEMENIGEFKEKYDELFIDHNELLNAVLDLQGIDLQMT